MKGLDTVGALLPLQGTFNCRDLGGYQAVDGRRVKHGCLLRGDALSQLTDTDLAALEGMGLKTVVDLRSHSETMEHPDRLPQGARLIVLSPIAQLAAQASASRSKGDAGRVQKLVDMASTQEGRAWFEKNMDSMGGQMRSLATEEQSIQAFRSLMQLLLGDNTPLLFHCKGGKDRTGWAAALILLALDVPRDTVIADYMATARYNRERNARRMDQYRQLTDNPIVLDFMSSLMQVKESYILAALEEVETLGGIDRYLREQMGLADEEREILRQKFLL